MRRSYTYTLSIVVILLGTAGCGSINRALQQRVAAETVDLEPLVTDDEAVARLATEAAETGLPEPRDIPLSDGDGLEDYVQIALRDNPTIRRAVRQVQAPGYEVPQVTSLDDPVVSLIPPTVDMIRLRFLTAICSDMRAPGSNYSLPGEDYIFTGGPLLPRYGERNRPWPTWYGTCLKQRTDNEPPTEDEVDRICSPLRPQEEAIRRFLAGKDTAPPATGEDTYR